MYINVINVYKCHDISLPIYFIIKFDLKLAKQKHILTLNNLLFECIR